MNDFCDEEEEIDKLNSTNRFVFLSVLTVLMNWTKQYVQHSVLNTIVGLHRTRRSSETSIKVRRRYNQPFDRLNN